MARKKVPDATSDEWLRTLGIESLSELDVFVFLHRHQTSLLGAEQIARLVGHGTGEVVSALDRLETAGLVQRSRVNQGARLYQPATPNDRKQRAAMGRLGEIVHSRAGRLRLAQKLRRRSALNPNEGDGLKIIPRSEGGETWPKAI